MNFSRMKMLKLPRRGAGFSGISTFSCGRKFIFSHMKMFGGGALLQNEELVNFFYPLGSIVNFF